MSYREEYIGASFSTSPRDTAALRIESFVPYTISLAVTVLRGQSGGEYSFFSQSLACNTELDLIVLEEVLHLATRVA